MKRQMFLGVVVLLVGAFGLPSNGLADLDSGLVAYWSFDEGGGDTAIFTIENPPVDFEVVDAEPFDGFGDNGPYSTFNDALLGTLGECRSMAEFDISSFSVPPGGYITSATFEVMITEIDISGLGVNGETPESLAVDGYVGNGLEELSDFEAGDGNVLDLVAIPDPQIGQVLSFNVTSFVIDLVDAQEQYVGLTIRAETFGGLWVTEGGVFPKLTIETYIANLPPVAVFNYSPENPLVNQTITFNASSSYDPDGTIVSYEWDFGDGDISDGELVNHSYPEDGTYNVTLTVADDDGASDSVSQDITVSLPRFIRGDAEADGDHDIFDGLRIIYWIGGDAPPPPCINSADAEDDEDVDLFDGLRVIYWIGGDAPPPPPPCCGIPGNCGADPTPGALSCDSYPPCMP